MVNKQHHDNVQLLALLKDQQKLLEEQQQQDNSTRNLLKLLLRILAKMILLWILLDLALAWKSLPQFGRQCQILSLVIVVGIASRRFISQAYITAKLFEKAFCCWNNMTHECRSEPIHFRFRGIHGTFKTSFNMLGHYYLPPVIMHR